VQSAVGLSKYRHWIDLGYHVMFSLFDRVSMQLMAIEGSEWCVCLARVAFHLFFCRTILVLAWLWSPYPVRLRRR
jgi:hypothetical protein